MNLKCPTQSPLKRAKSTKSAVTAGLFICLFVRVLLLLLFKSMEDESDEDRSRPGAV